MRIALIVTEYVTEATFDGGLASYASRIASALTRAGHEAVVFVEADQNETFFHEGIRVERVKYRRVPWVALLNLATLRRGQRFFNFLRKSWNLNAVLKKHHRLTPFDLVQYTHLGGLGIFRPKHIQAVVRLSSYTPLWRQFGEYSDRSRFQVWQQALAEDLALKRADAVFGPCARINAFVQSKLNIRVHILESPFIAAAGPEDGSLFQQQLAGKKYLLFFGRLNRPKGVLVIADMIEELLQKHPDLFYVFIGKETTGFEGRPMMEHLYDRAGKHRDRVLYLGRIPQSQLFPVVRNAAAVTLPALIENFPNVCLEAMSAGQVIIATRDSGFEQLLKHEESGWLCRPCDPGSLLAAIERALSMNGDGRARMGAAAKKRVAALNPERVAADHLEFYSRTIAESRSGSR